MKISRILPPGTGGRVRVVKPIPSLIAVICLFEAGCGSSSANAPDAGGGDVAQDVTTTDDGGTPDEAAADVASDTGAGDVAGSDGGGTDGADGGDDPCYPPCRSRLYGGCPVAGTCVYTPGNFCYSNGVMVVFAAPGGPTRETISKNGVVCATLDATNVFRDPNGAALGTVSNNSDGSQNLNCTGEAPVTIPKSCTIPCVAGMCPP